MSVSGFAADKCINRLRRLAIGYLLEEPWCVHLSESQFPVARSGQPGNYKPGFRIDLHIKDLNNALNASHAINMPVPMTAHMMEVMQELKNHDEGSCDHDDIIRYYERMTGVSVVKGK